MQSAPSPAAEAPLARRARLLPIREKVRELLLRGKFSGNAKLIGFCEELYDRREHLWTFTRVEGIEPTNNTAERALRPAVIYRKLSFGTQSASGSRYLERLLSVSETCRLQSRNAYQYLIQVGGECHIDVLVGDLADLRLAGNDFDEWRILIQVEGTSPQTLGLPLKWLSQQAQFDR